jgi:hypothetical protein
MLTAQQRMSLDLFLKSQGVKKSKPIPRLRVIGIQSHVHNGGFLFDENDPSTRRRAFRTVNVQIKYQPHVHKPGKGYTQRLTLARRLASLKTEQA